MKPILITSDLDRTIIPNGEQPESREARSHLATLVARPEVTLSYVSGRSSKLIQEAIGEHELPVPDFAIGDVGTTIYEVGEQEMWQPLAAWSEAIGKDWNGRTWPDVKALFEGVGELRLQDEDPTFQNTYKVSYYTATDIDRDELIGRLERLAAEADINASFIWSVDEERHTGLLDVLPKSATKLHAVEFLRDFLGFANERVVFAGDSGNDLPALTSGLQAVLVKNARREIKNEALAHVIADGRPESLYIAQGNFLGMNGNYSAGVLEGVAHYFPEVAAEVLVR